MPDLRSERPATLRAVAPQPMDRLLYDYDFCDGWEHDVVVEEPMAPERGARHPVCVGGDRAAPPEDCGGIFGYHEMLEPHEDEEHPNYEETLA